MYGYEYFAIRNLRDGAISGNSLDAFFVGIGQSTVAQPSIIHVLDVGAFQGHLHLAVDRGEAKRATSSFGAQISTISLGDAIVGRRDGIHFQFVFLNLRRDVEIEP